MPIISRIVIIFNPNSTGDSPAIAKEFHGKLHKKLPHTPIELLKTQHAGHARELAYRAASKTKNVLIISVSGDGGYNEVINGAMQAVDEEKGSPICAVLPGGNANDHYTSTSRGSLLKAIANTRIEHMDLLTLRLNNKKYYAHSYIGLGLTPLVAVELNRHTLSAFREMWLAFKTFWTLRPFTIEIDSKRHTFDSLVLSNIDRMAKHLTLATDSSPKDGKFEVIMWPHAHKIRLIYALVRSVFGHSQNLQRMNRLSFLCLEPMPLQYDGEVIHLKRHTKVIVTAAPGKLRTIR